MVFSLLGVLVIAILVFCVLVVVLAALRPSLFSPFVRGFTSKDAESNEEAQGKIKSINWKKGLFRLTLVLSILFGLFAGIVNAEPRDHHSVDRFLVSFFIVFGLIWLVYFVLNYVIRNLAGRVTFVLSMLFGLFAGIVNGEIHDSGAAFAAGFLVPFGLTWLVYFAVGFVIRGFASKGNAKSIVRDQIGHRRSE